MQNLNQYLLARWLLPCCMMAISILPSSAEEKIYQTDSVGNIQYHKPSQTIINKQ